MLMGWCTSLARSANLRSCELVHTVATGYTARAPTTRLAKGDPMRMTRWLLGIACLLLAIGVHAAVVDIEAGPIFNNADAAQKCPGVCSQRGAIKWTGDWRTTVMAQMSVCSCQFAEPKPVRPTPAAPLAGSNRTTPPAPLAGSNACSVGGTNKCPGCAVSCESGMRPVCTPPTDGFTSWCQSDASCRCVRQ